MLKLKKISLTMLVLLLFSASAFALDVYIWDYDNGYTVPNMDTGTEWGIEDGVEQALIDIGIEPTVNTILPTDLSEYDIVFVIGGIWCYS